MGVPCSKPTIVPEQQVEEVIAPPAKMLAAFNMSLSTLGQQTEGATMSDAVTANASDMFSAFKREFEKIRDDEGYHFRTEQAWYDRVYQGRLGSGSFGIVYKCQSLTNSKMVFALKDVNLNDLDLQNDQQLHKYNLFREIAIYKSLRKHVNIIAFKEATKYRKRDLRFSLIFELCETDLYTLYRNVKLRPVEQKTIMKQLFQGLHFLHVEARLMHRDLKPANILINQEGIVKICDFGLSRYLEDQGESSSSSSVPLSIVGTESYQAVEIVLEMGDYGPSCDIWSLGVLFAELLIKGLPFRRYRTQRGRLLEIIKYCGSITPQMWPACPDLDRFEGIPMDRPRRLKEHIEEKRNRVDPENKCAHALDLIDQLLVYDPSQRLDTSEALNHSFFSEAPKPRDNIEAALERLRD